MAKAIKKKKADISAKAFHGKTKDGNDVVAMLNLHVVVIPDGKGWFAQGLEIDFAASGSSLDDVKSRFEDSLALTVHEHLKIFGDIDKILVPAPQEVWKEMYYSKALAEHFSFSQISFHELKCLQGVLPFQGIEYVEQAMAA